MAASTEATLLVKPEADRTGWRRFVSAHEASALIACLMFMACSATMLIVNKVVIVHFATPNLVVLVQLLIAIAACLTFLYPTLHFGSRADVVHFATVVPLLYAGVICSSAVAQQYASLGLQIVIRNTGPLVSLPIERMLNEPIVADVWTYVSLVSVLGGVALYVLETVGKVPYPVEHVKQEKDGANLPLGVVLMFINLLFAIFERMFQRKLLALKPVDVSKTGMMLINNVVSLPPVSLIILALGEYKWEHVKHWGTVGASPTMWYHWALLAVSGICGVAISWTGINALHYVSATTMLLVTNLNKVRGPRPPQPNARSRTPGSERPNPNPDEDAARG
jgi:drug/metabolite transporter (DMT)-like permease